MIRLSLAMILGLQWLCAVASAQGLGQPARMALLIGNQGYSAKVGPLKNPHNDVDLVGAALRQLGFTVTILKDATYKQTDTALKRYVTEVRRAGRGTLSFFYYSGHGVANPETQLNYLIPVDVADAEDDKVWFESFQQNVIIDLFSKQAANATHYLVFDACRNELNVGGAAAKSLGADKGFVPVADTSGLLIAYATAPKKTASDAGHGGGPYAKVLAEELVRPGVESVGMFRNVQIRVKQSIGQDPWLSFPSLPPVYLAGREAQPAQQVPQGPAPAPPARASDAAEAWSVAEKSTDPVVLEAYIRRFGDTFYGDLAKTRLAALKDEQQRVALLAQQETARTRAAAAETQRLADLAAAEERRKAQEMRPGRVFRDCNDGCPEMVVVPAGRFKMGERGSARDVTIQQAFALGKLEVTFDEWAACVTGGGCTSNRSPSDRGWGKGRRPVINVSWNDAIEYVAWLSLKTGQTYRLPTEAEWEYAARAGTTTAYWWGDNFDFLRANNGSQTVSVGRYAANAFGLHDMHGNVSEWCEDAYDASSRVVRGGSWGNNPSGLRSATRFVVPPGDRGGNVGFRVARTL